MLPNPDAPRAAERAVTPPWSRPDDAVRQAQLDAMKRQATGLLALAAAVFVGASPERGGHSWLGVAPPPAAGLPVGGLAHRVPALLPVCPPPRRPHPPLPLSAT